METRTAALRLHREGHGSRKIAQALGISRTSVRRIIQSGEARVPPIDREDGLTVYVDRIRALHESCRGNLVRVTEELCSQGIEVPYSTLTGFCRRHGIGVTPKQRADRYHFEPGEEMQHDTSPHTVEVGGKTLRLECASVVLCYSRMAYIQCFERWNRFLARVFLTDAIRYFGGAAQQCMLDNSTVIVLRGTGPDAVITPEMAAFARRFDFKFIAHQLGDANRSARVERPFHHVENNFYAGRTFADVADLNTQLLTWCDAKNKRWTRTLQAKPIELFAAERPSLKPLPLHIPDVYDLHHRRVDLEGYINLHRNRYSAPEALIGRQVAVHEHLHRVRLFDGHQLVCEHDKAEYGATRRITLPEHRGRKQRSKPKPLPEEGVLRNVGPTMSALVDALKKRHGGRAARALRRLHRIYIDYPTDAVTAAVSTALDYGLLDLTRIETIVLRNVQGDFFHIKPTPTEEDHGRRSRTTPEEPETTED